jgi:hypothetical protein
MVLLGPKVVSLLFQKDSRNAMITFLQPAKSVVVRFECSSYDKLGNKVRGQNL